VYIKIQTKAWHCFNSRSTLLLFVFFFNECSLLSKSLGCFQCAHVAACNFLLSGVTLAANQEPNPGKLTVGAYPRVRRHLFGTIYNQKCLW
jgi:hypothetical protein